MSGLVEVLKVATDSRESLVHVIKILQRWNSGVTHYRTGKDINGLSYLILMWHQGESHLKAQPLLAPMKDAEAIADQISAWLKVQEYGPQPDHDGSNNRGWIATNSGPVVSETPNEYYKPDQDSHWKTFKTYDSSFYDVICIQPYWIEYHK